MLPSRDGADNDSAPDLLQFRGSNFIYDQTSRIAPVPAGVARLAFLVRLTRGTERYLLGFKIGDYSEGLALEVTEREIFDFGNFQRLALTKLGVFISSHGNRCWNEAIANAAISGARLDLDNPLNGFEGVLIVVNRTKLAVI